MQLSEVKKRQQLNLQELYQINWFLGAGLALLSMWPSFYLSFSVFPHLLGACFLIGLSIFRPQITAVLPRVVWQALPFLLIILLALDLKMWSEPVPALVRLNILLVLYRALAFRRKREDLQLIVLSLFLVIIAGVVTVNFAFPLQILLFTAVAMSFLFNITLMEDSRDTVAPKEVWRHFTWRRFLRKIFSRCDAGFLVVAGIAFSSVIAFSVLLFLAIPRFDIHNPLPFLGLKRAAQTGFGESINFGDVTDIRNDHSVALRVEVISEKKIPPDPYWRMLVLDEYTNGGFRLSLGLQHNARSEKKVAQIRHDDVLIQNDPPVGESSVWTFYLEGGVARYLPLTGRFERIRFQDFRDFIYMPQTEVLGIPQVNSSMLVYQVENMEFGGVSKDPAFGTYTLDYDWYPELSFSDSPYRNYPDTTVALPPGPDDVAFLRELVMEIGQGEALTALEFAARATAYIQARHSYSMSWSLPPGNGDHVVRWLKSREPGHCEVFAGALLLVSRAAGIPARVVTGFRGGAWNTYENYFMVRNSDAHAWVEIFDGKDSWIRVDPTPGGELPAAGDNDEEVDFAQLPFDSSIAAYVDSLRILWYRRIVSFDQSSQFEIWSAIQERYGQIQIGKHLSAFKDFVTAWWRAPWDFGRLFELLGLAAASGLTGLLVTFIWRQRVFLFSGRDADPVRRRAGRQLQRLRTLPPPKEADEAREKLFGEIQLQLQRLRYGPPDRRGDWRGVLSRARRLARAWK